MKLQLNFINNTSQIMKSFSRMHEIDRNSIVPREQTQQKPSENMDTSKINSTIQTYISQIGEQKKQAQNFPISIKKYQQIEWKGNAEEQKINEMIREEEKEWEKKKSHISLVFSKYDKEADGILKTKKNLRLKYEKQTKQAFEELRILKKQLLNGICKTKTARMDQMRQKMSSARQNIVALKDQHKKQETLIRKKLLKMQQKLQTRVREQEKESADFEQNLTGVLEKLMGKVEKQLVRRVHSV